MPVESAVRAFAGSLVLLSLSLAEFVSPWALLIAAFVGLNLVQSAFTGFCPAAKVFAALGMEQPVPGVASSERPS